MGLVLTLLPTAAHKIAIYLSRIKWLTALTLLS